MKKIYLLIFMLACFHLSKAQNPVPNPDFANWSSGNPVSWSTDNYPEWITITQVSPGYDGSSYAAKGQAVVFETDTFPALLVSSSTLGGAGFAITQAYSNLQFYYKTSLLSGDELAVVVAIYDAGSNIIGEGGDTVTTNASAFTEMQVNITYTGSTAPATAVIEFVSTAKSLSSYFIVDNVSLNGITGVNNMAAVLGSYNVFPNPASKNLNLNVNLTSDQKVEIRVYNVLGAEVATPEIYQGKQGDNRYEMDVANLPQGIYFAHIMLDGVLTSTRQIIVSR